MAPPRSSQHEKGDKQGRMPIHIAAANAKANEIKVLLATGANPNVQDAQGWSPLHFAAQSCASDCIEALIDAGADVTLQDIHGNTALFRAVFSYRGDGACIERLLGAGADPLSINKHGTSPASLARQIANYDVAKFFADK